MTNQNSDKIIWQKNRPDRKEIPSKQPVNQFSQEIAEKVINFHKTIPGYRPTPLIKLDNLAKQLGVSSILIKDESQRFGLNAFKALGASYALSLDLSERIGFSQDEISFTKILSPEIKAKLKDITCITATDGNHGRAVAWTAESFGCKSVVYMPRGSSPTRLENIRKHGANAKIIDGNYDDAVRLAAKHAIENNWILVQDTVAWPEYTKIPMRIMQGYITMILEALFQMNEKPPTHMFAQCGVGSFAAAIEGYLTEKFRRARPVFAVVEPTKAACFLESIKKGGSNPFTVSGDMDTIMAGLACGEPSIIAWEILRDYADIFIACPDDVTRRGMRVLGNPVKGDKPLISGESGAVTLGLLYEVVKNPDYQDLKKVLELNRESKILLFSTEGDTDPDMYKEIVWGG